MGHDSAGFGDVEVGVSDYVDKDCLECGGGQSESLLFYSLSTRVESCSGDKSDDFEITPLKCTGKQSLPPADRSAQATAEI